MVPYAYQTRTRDRGVWRVACTLCYSVSTPKEYPEKRASSLNPEFLDVWSSLHTSSETAVGLQHGL